MNLNTISFALIGKANKTHTLTTPEGGLKRLKGWEKGGANNLGLGREPKGELGQKVKNRWGSRLRLKIHCEEEERRKKKKKK